VPTAVPGENHELVMPVDIGATWSRTIADVPIHFEYVAEIMVNDQPQPNNSGISMGTQYDENQFVSCRIQIAPRWVAADRLVTPGTTGAGKYEAQAASLAGMVARCLYEAQSEDATEDGRTVSGAWVNLYLEWCGPIMQPLGMPVSDGTCDVPPFSATLPG